MAVNVSGQMVHAVADYRDPRLAALSLDELAQLDAINKKLLPVASQDGSQNQIESNRAIETAEAKPSELMRTSEVSKS